MWFGRKIRSGAQYLGRKVQQAAYIGKKIVDAAPYVAVGTGLVGAGLRAYANHVTDADTIRTQDMAARFPPHAAQRYAENFRNVSQRAGDLAAMANGTSNETPFLHVNNMFT